MRRATETKVFQYVSEEGVKAFIVTPLAENNGITCIVGYDLKADREVKLTEDDDIEVLHWQNRLPAPLKEGSFHLSQNGTYKIYYRNDLLLQIEQLQLLIVKVTVRETR
jgi:hypothetical protein